MEAIENMLIDALPEIYQPLAEDPSSPLHALITIAGEFFSPIVVELERIDANFDPQRAPAEPDPKGRGFLDWLASWVMVDIHPNWPGTKRRFLIQQADDLYRIRGTAQGLKTLIEFFFDIEVAIREWQWPAGVVIGHRSTLNVDTKLIDPSGGQCCFEVRWHPRPDHWDQLEQLTAMIRTVIDREKPVHTRCYFNVVMPAKPTVKLSGLVINVTSTIGAFVIY